MTPHECPGGCGRRDIAYTQLSCRPCWFRLPMALRTAVTTAWQNRRQPGGLARHSDAIRAAKDWYRTHPIKPTVIDEVHTVTAEQLRRLAAGERVEVPGVTSFSNAGPAFARVRIDTTVEKPVDNLPPERSSETESTVPPGVLVLHGEGLFSKFGFNDGDVPDAFQDWLDDRGVIAPRHDVWHAALVSMVREYLLPLLPTSLQVYEISTIHNPIRAVDGQEPPAGIEAIAVSVQFETVLEHVAKAADHG